MGLITFAIMALYGHQLIGKNIKRDLIFFPINGLFLIMVAANRLSFLESFIVVLVGYCIFAIVDVATTHITKI